MGCIVYNYFLDQIEVISCKTGRLFIFLITKSASNEGEGIF
jgi:hypothetical protein